jgi:hypothetical protein
VVRRLIQASAAVLLLAAVGCTAPAPAEPTGPMPTPAAPTDPAQPTSAGPSPESTPTEEATDAATSPPASPSPVPAAGWQELAGFPGADALVVGAAAATSGGLVAVGAEPAAGEDLDGVRQGIVWRSGDGLAWDREADATFHGTTLDGVVELGGTLFVFGFRDLCGALDEECPPADTGYAGWRESAGGWQQLSLPSTMRSGVVDGIALAGDQIVARGTYGDDIEPHIWLSADGDRWTSLGDLGGLEYVAEVAALEGAVIALGTSYDFDTDTIATRAAISFDGSAFEQATIDAAASATIEGIAAGPAGLLAVGNVVPADQPDSGVVVLLSANGREWRVLPAEAFAGASVWAAHSLASGYLVLGSQVVPGTGGLSTGRAWWSADAATWVTLAGLEGPLSELTATAVGPSGVVAFTVDLSAEQPVVRGWHAGPEVYTR